MDAPIRFAKDIARRLGEMPRMAAVALGGSWARGQGDPDSEVDLRVYYRPEDPLRPKLCIGLLRNSTSGACPTSRRTT